MKDLASRMKRYEQPSQNFLTGRVPVIIRVDGRSFHKFLSHDMWWDRPYDERFMGIMNAVAWELYTQVDGSKLVYCQSDEISLVITDYDTVHTQSWFNYNLNKLTSITASVATAKFAEELVYSGWRSNFPNFDSRAFNVPESDVQNYFLWRQKDWCRNSLSMLARTIFTQKELHGKKFAEVIKMCADKGKDWRELSSHLKYGRVIAHGELLEETPMFNHKNFDLWNYI